MRQGEISSKDVARTVRGKSAKDREEIFEGFRKGDPAHSNGCGTEAADFIHRCRNSVAGEAAVALLIQEEIDTRSIKNTVVGL